MANRGLPFAPLGAVPAIPTAAGAAAAAATAAAAEKKSQPAVSIVGRLKSAGGRLVDFAPRPPPLTPTEQLAPGWR